jgi:peptidoglycan/LPS O-acetylase OafA/YrhL
VTQKAERQYELDILRILAILYIVLHHYTFRGFAADNYSILSFPQFTSVFKYGYLGVYLFLLISGYVMAMSAPNKGLKDFTVSRLLRLFPLFWIAISIIAVVTLLIGADRFQVTPLQYLSNLTMFSENLGFAPLDGAHWFMAVILRFNVIIAIIIMFKLTKYQEYLVGIWLLLAGLVYFLDLPIIDFFVMPIYAPFIIGGIIFYLARTKGWSIYRYTVIILSLAFAIYTQIKTSDLELHYQTGFSSYVVSGLVLGFYLIFYLLTWQKRPLKLPGILALLGAATFPLYLLHQYIGYMIFDYFGESVDKYLLLSLTTIAMIAASIVITKYVEPYVYSKSRKAVEATISATGRLFQKKIGEPQRGLETAADGIDDEDPGPAGRFS